MAASTDLSRIKILVIDDDELVRLTLKNSIKKLGFSVFEAQNGNEGIALYKRERPHLVITDILMPDKEGLETITEIRAMDPSAKIIAMSGGGAGQNMSFLQLAQRLGADRIMSKPVKPDELVNVVRSLLAV